MENLSANTNSIDNQKIQLPNSTGVLAMGTISLISILCVPAGLLGIILGILALTMGSNAIKIYKLTPEKYTEKSFKNAKAGKTCGIISLSLIGLSIVVLLIIASVVGWAIIGTFLTTMPWDMM